MDGKGDETVAPGGAASVAKPADVMTAAALPEKHQPAAPTPVEAHVAADVEAAKAAESTPQ